MTNSNNLERQSLPDKNEILGNAFNHPSLNGTILGTGWGYFPLDWGSRK